jgi:hypothetical protein
MFGLKTMHENLFYFAKSNIGKTLPSTRPLFMQTERAHILQNFNRLETYPARTAPVP